MSGGRVSRVGRREQLNLPRPPLVPLQGRFGATVYEPARSGAASRASPPSFKPTAVASQAVSRYVSDLRSSGLLTPAPNGSWPGVGALVINASDSPGNALHLRWAFTAPGAYLAADTRYNDSASLAFSADDGGTIAVVAVRWPVSAALDESAAYEICVTASADCSVDVNTAALVPGVPPALGVEATKGRVRPLGAPFTHTVSGWVRLHVLEAAAASCINVTSA